MHLTGNGVEIGYFDEPVGDVSRLAAVVVRRGDDLKTETTSVFSRRGLTSMLGFWRSRFIPPPRIPEVELPALEPVPDGFRSAAGVGSTRMLFSRSMRKVRFGDVDYPLAVEGLTTVILVDDRRVPRRIEVRSMTAPTVARPRLDRSLEKSEMIARITSGSRLAMAAWAEALLADPVIREFTHGTFVGR